MHGESSAKREYRDDNVFLKVDRALSKLITLLILNKKELNDFFKDLKIKDSCERSELRAKRAIRMCERSEPIFYPNFIIYSYSNVF